MRFCVALALVSTLASTTVLAAPKDKKKKDDAGEEKKAGTSMDSGGDPAYTEKSDDGPYAPKTPDEAPAQKTQVKTGAATQLRMRPRDKLVLFGEVFYGAGRSPRPGAARVGETEDAKVLTVLLGGAYDLSPKFTLGLRAPWSTASVDLPDRVNTQSSTAFGSPQIFAEYRLQLGRPTVLPILFGVGVPIAQGNHDPIEATDDLGQRQAEVNLLADAAQGWRDGELYAPKRVPVVLGAGVRHERGALELHAWTKFVFGIDIGGEILPDSDPVDGRLVRHSLALRDVTLAGASYQFLDKPGLWAGLDAWLVYNVIEAFDYESDAVDPTPFQFVVEPRIGAVFGKLRPSLGVVLPIGGRLADGGMTGFRLHVEYAF